MTLALIVTLLVVPSHADGNDPDAKVDKHAGAECTFPYPMPVTGNTLPVQVSIEDCGVSSSPFKYLSSDVVPAHPQTGDIIRVTNQFSLAENVSELQFKNNFEVRLYHHGELLSEHEVGGLCGHGPMETSVAWETNLGRISVAVITMCGVQCPMIKGSVWSITFAMQITNDRLATLAGKGDFGFSLQFTAHTTPMGPNGNLLCVNQNFGIPPWTFPLGTAEANQTAQVVVV